jgi:hypothetical protein
MMFAIMCWATAFSDCTAVQEYVGPVESEAAQEIQSQSASK